MATEHLEKEPWMLASTTKFLFLNATQAIFASIFIILVFSWANRVQVQASLICQVWLIFGLSLGAIRALHFGLYLKRYKLLSVTQWLNSYRLLTFFSGAVYGSMTLLFFEASTAPLKVFNMFIVVGMGAAAVGTHSVDKVTFRLFMLSVALPTSFTLYFLDDSVFQSVAGLILIFIVVMDQSASLTGQAIRDNFLMTYTMRYRATHDPLVGLYNREELEHQFELRAPRSKRSVAMMFVDLDNFKPLNDTLGHQAGDKALQEVAGIIKHSVRADDIAARLGGDEFVVLLLLDTEDEALTIADNILKGISEMQFEGDYQGLSASIGIAFHETTAVGFSRLMRIADIACYDSKNLGKKRITVRQYSENN